MATNSKWLEPTPTADINSTTYFQGLYQLDTQSVLALANFIINGGGFTGLFSKPENWLSSLMCYPYDIPNPNTQINRDKRPLLRVGVNDSKDIRTTELNEGLCYYYLGEWYCKKHFNNFADYNGYTKIKVYLPYAQEIELMPNEVMGKYVQFRLKVDYKTGNGVYYIAVSDTHIEPPIDQPYARDSDGSCRILTTVSVTLGQQVPLGTTNTSDVYRSMIMGTILAASNVASGYAATALAPSTRIASQSTTTYNVQGRTTAKGSRLKPIKTGDVSKETTVYKDKETDNINRSVSGCFDTALSALSAMHTTGGTDRIPNISLNINAYKSIKVVVYRPRFIETTADYNALYGKPYGDVAFLNEMKGYTEISAVHIEGEHFSQATGSEISMLEKALQGGIII